MTSNLLVIGTFQDDSLESFFSDALKKYGNVVKHDIGSNIIVKYRQQIIIAFPFVWSFYLKMKLSKMYNYNFDIIFIIMRDLPLSNLKDLKNNHPNSKIVNINPDQMTTIGNMTSLSNLYDLVFLKDKYLGEKMINVGAKNIRYWLECYPQKWNNIILDYVPNDNIVILGNIYYYRHLFIESLICNYKVKNLKIYGKSDKHVRSLKKNYQIEDYIYGKEKLSIIRSSKIIINNLHFAEITSANNKFFEIAGIGGFILTEFSSDIYSILPEKLRILIWKNMDELNDKIKYFINNPKEREELRIELNNYAKENFTYDISVKQILNKIYNH